LIKKHIEDNMVIIILFASYQYKNLYINIVFKLG
jgi:hypothetical protein